MKKLSPKALSLLFIGVAVVFIVVFILFQSPFSKKTDVHLDEHEHDHPMDGSPTLTDPFQEEEPPRINNITFNDPVRMTLGELSDASPHLIGASKEYVLIKTYGDYLHLYNIKVKSRTIIDRLIDEAILLPDGKFVIYYNEPLMNQGEITAYDPLTETKTTLLKLPYGEKLTQLAYHEGALVYSTHPMYEEKKITNHSLILPVYANMYPPAAQKTELPSGDTAWDGYKKDMYMYIPSTQTIDRIQYGSGTFPFSSLTKEPIAKVTKIELSDSGNWFGLYTSTTGAERNLVVDGATISDFDDIFDVSWFQDQLVINDTFNLYLFHPKTKTKSLLKSDVSDFYIHDNRIYYRDTNNTFKYIEAK